MARESEHNEICCPRFDPEPWDQKAFDWKEKRFVKESVFTLFYMPVNFGSVMKKLDKQVRSAGGTILGGLCLSDHTSKWNMDVYVAVDREVPGAQNTSLSGRFASKVYEGSFKETGTWCKDFEQYAGSQALKIRKWYMWYTTCPRCAKKYGKNYVAVLAEVEKS
jgi:hypothetical protein